MKYELYHDESIEGGYWHGMLLIPVGIKEQLVQSLVEARKNTRYNDPIGIKRVKRHGRIYDCSDAWIQIGIAILRAHSKNQFYPIFLGKRENGRKVYEFFSLNCYGGKFILFCERDKHQQMGQHRDYASKIETTFRMGLKGGLHFLGNEERPILLERMHFDGHEHYRRHLDKDRIVGRLYGLRGYCSIANSEGLIDDRSSDHRKIDSQEYIDCQLLQLTDLLIGCSRTLLGISTKGLHRELSSPLRSIFHRYREGYARMQNSRWCNSICMSRCFLDDGQWNFETIVYGEDNSMQMKMPL